MKKYLLAMVICISFFLTGCATFSEMGFTQSESGSMWSDYDYHNQEVGYILDSRYPRSHPRNVRRNPKYRNYQRPRKYNVTSQDEEKYQSIQDRIAKRKMKGRSEPVESFGHPTPSPQHQPGHMGAP